MTAEQRDYRPLRPGLGEGVLFHGYAGAARVEACLCGGWIRAYDSERSIAAAVAAHNARRSHAAWAIAAGWR